MGVKIAFLNRKKFNRAIRKHVKNFTDKELLLFIRGLALKMLRGFVLRTPVDTGFARNNWQVTRGSIGNDAPYPANKSGDVAGRELSVINSIAKLEDLKQIVYIWNAVPYIIPLETGHSDKAPEGMLKVTFAELASELSSRYDFVGYYKAKS